MVQIFDGQNRNHVPEVHNVLQQLRSLAPPSKMRRPPASSAAAAHCPVRVCMELSGTRPLTPGLPSRCRRHSRWCHPPPPPIIGNEAQPKNVYF